MIDWLPERLPEALEVERSLLSTLCAPGADRKAAEFLPSLCKNDFVHPAHREVFTALASVVRSGEELSTHTLLEAMSDKGHKVGGFAGMTELLSAEEVGRPQTLIDILTRKRKQRELIKLGSQLVRSASEEEAAPEALAQSAAGDLADLSTSSRKGGLVAFGNVSRKVSERIAQERISGKVRGTRTGIPSLDRMTRGGFRPGQLIILAARPGIGKTSLVLQWSITAATGGKSVAFFSLEMGEDEVYNRAISQRSGIPAQRMEAHDLSREETIAISEADADLSSSALLIDDQAEITVADIRARVDRASVQLGETPSLVVVDYLQLISSPQDSRGAKQNETQRIGEISRALKLLAKDRGVPVVVLSQLNRDVEKRQNGKPILSDLRDSGSIEQDADMVLFIHRDAKPGLPEALQSKTGDLIVAKHRGGPCGSIALTWDGPTTSFKELEQTTGARLQKPIQQGIQWGEESA